MASPTRVGLLLAALLAAAAAAAVAPPGVAAQLPVRFNPVARNLKGRVVWLTPVPGFAHNTRYVFCTLAGSIVTMTTDNRQLLFMDFKPFSRYSGESGLLSIVFHPRFSSNRRFFMTWVDKELYWNLGEFRAYIKDGLPWGNVTTLRTLMRMPKPEGYQNHNGGMLQFASPNNSLYIGVGDGGAGYGIFNTQNDPFSLFGSILRISVDCPAGTRTPYCVPPDNPFASRNGGNPAVYFKGIRNPWRFWIDGSLMYLADVGQDLWEEINVVGYRTLPLNNRNQRVPLDFGWNTLEGYECLQMPYEEPKTCSKTGFVLPKLAYAHEVRMDSWWCSVTGGAVYRGAAFPRLTGRYFYGDFCSGIVCSFVFNTTTRRVRGNECYPQYLGPLTSFGVDNSQNLYALTFDTIYRIEI